MQSGTVSVFGSAIVNVPLTPLRCLDRAADLFASKVGVVCGNTVLTYGAFAERCFRLAAGLKREGIAKGDRVAFLSFNTHRLLEGYYGVVQAHAVAMPINVRLSPPEIVNILHHSGAKLVCFEADFAPVVEAIRPLCPAVAHWVSLDAELACADFSYEQMIAAAEPMPLDVLAYDENSMAELFYTSGSTGTPKAVMLSHRNLFLHALSVAGMISDPGSAVDLHTIPLFHANGWGRPQVSTMLGITQVMVRRFEPSLVFSLIQAHGATDMCLVPTMANMLLNTPDRERFDLSTLRRIMLGGAASSADQIRRMEDAFHCEIIAGYGLTETSPVLTCGLRKSTVEYANPEERHRRQAMAGWSLPAVKVIVADLYDNPVPRDGQAIGEVLAQGDSVMMGYYNEPDATESVLHNNWFHTGDMATWDEEGYVQIVDRKKEIIISGGENISSLEIERAIFAHDSVQECAVVGAPDDRWGEVPVAIVYLKASHSLSEAALLAFLETRLGKFKLPRSIEFSPEPLPKTGTGKLRKMALREQFWAGKARRVQG